MGNPNSKSSFKNNNLSKQINFMGNTSQNNGKYSGIKSDNDVLTKFTWNYGGNSVYLTGSFNNWKKNISMEKQGDQFCITLLLPRQVHQYKFIVDGEWRFSPEDATMSDNNGYVNNYIDTTNFQPLIQGNNKTNDIDDLSGPLYPKHSKQNQRQKEKKTDKKQQYAKYAPKLPPHYQYCLYLGKKTLQNQNGLGSLGSLGSNNSIFSSNKINLGMGMGEDEEYSTISRYDSITEPMAQPPSPTRRRHKHVDLQNYQATLTQQQVEYLFKTPHSLPMPTHITLDHIMTQEGEWYSAMAITQRFKQKYTTFTFYTIEDKIGQQGGQGQGQGQGIGAQGWNGKFGGNNGYYQGKGVFHHNSSTF